MTHRLLAGIILILSLTFFALCGHNLFLRNKVAEANAKVVEIGLERDGFRVAAEAKPKEVVKLVEKLVPVEVKDAIKKRKVQPIASAHGEATTMVTVPCPDPPPDITPTVIPEPRAVEVGLSFTGDLFIAKISGSRKVEWTGSFSGEATLPDGKVQPLDFAPEAVKFDVMVNEDIAKALYDHEREGGWLKRHTALVCPGVGVTYNPLDTTRPVNVGVTCTYGFSFF